MDRGGGGPERGNGVGEAGLKLQALKLVSVHPTPQTVLQKEKEI